MLNGLSKWSGPSTVQSDLVPRNRLYSWAKAEKKPFNRKFINRHIAVVLRIHKSLADGNVMY